MNSNASDTVTSALKAEQLSSSKRVFVAPSVTQAMHAVRHEMGDHAVIVQVRRSVGDDDLVEVVASCGGEEQNLAEVVVPDPYQTELMKSFANILTDYFSTALQSRLLQTAENLLRENDYADAQILMADVLDKEIARLDILDPDLPKLPMMFFGPAGMGKTSAVMKFALQYRLDSESVRLFNLDSKRVGNRYTIANFAKLTDVKAHHVRSEGVQRKIDAGHGSFDLIDTPPVNPLVDEELTSLLEVFSDMPMYRLLVISHTCEMGLLRLILDAVVQHTHIDGLVISGMDSFPDYGRLLNLLLESGLPLVGISTSAEITSAAAMPNAQQLVRLLLSPRKISFDKAQ